MDGHVILLFPFLPCFDWESAIANGALRNRAGAYIKLYSTHSLCSSYRLHVGCIFPG